MATTSKHYIVILCGGTGPKLWPLSRAYYPKQFLKLFGSKSLFQQTIARAQKIVPSKRIFIVSNNRYRSLLEQSISKKIPKENIIFEPVKRNTAMAILLATSIIYRKDHQTTITVMPSDHYVKQKNRFSRSINQSVVMSRKLRQIITIGIKPTYPNLSFSYILPQKKNQKISQVNLFTQKPDFETAQNLIKKGALWNSGIYTFLPQVLIDEFQNLQPEFKPIIDKLFTNDNLSKTINSLYKATPDIDIDKAISEKSHNMSVIPISSDWSDVGEWKSIYQHLEKDKFGIAKLHQETQFLQVNSKNCLVSTSKNKLISLVDVDNLAVIDTPDGLLICNIHQDGSSKVRDIVNQIIKNKNYHRFFLKKL